MPAKDLYSFQPASAAGPADFVTPVVPSDTADLTYVTKGLYIGTGGNVAVRLFNGQATVVYKNLTNGGYISARVDRVLATGTTASDILAEA